jgi:hypothetical protein
VRIYLEFGPDATPALRSRLTYALRLFCAVYDHEPLLDRERLGEADVSIRYSASAVSKPGEPCLFLNHLAGGRSPRDPAPAPTLFTQGDESTVLFYPPVRGGEPDWLGEIFEWVSCADEYSVERRDVIGRIPFGASYAGRHHLDIRMPYAAVAMRLLERNLSRLANRPAGSPSSPVSATSHFVVVTHDVDYLPAGRWNAARRLAKNSAISLLGKRQRLSAAQARMALSAAAFGHDPLDAITKLALKEKLCGIGASFYFLLRQVHRRDANYTCEGKSLLEWMNVLEGSGFEIGVHGSYTSLDEPEGLSREYEIERRLGFDPLGGRQHWLRFTPDRLIPAIEEAGASYDTSIGWSDRIGFRAGACFAFPPYFFEKERPATFLEIPLVIMDQGLQAETGGGRCDACSHAESVLSNSRRYGWGGTSLLWHPTAFGGGWLAPEIGEAFWQLADEGRKRNEAWVSGKQFLEAAWQRYANVGLLPAHGVLENAETRNRSFEARGKTTNATSSLPLGVSGVPAQAAAGIGKGNL